LVESNWRDGARFAANEFARPEEFQEEPRRLKSLPDAQERLPPLAGRWESKENADDMRAEERFPWFHPLPVEKFREPPRAFCDQLEPAQRLPPELGKAREVANGCEENPRDDDMPRDDMMPRDAPERPPRYGPPL
jgi:hypothetical protein